jgi:hypothetical protein
VKLKVREEREREKERTQIDRVLRAAFFCAKNWWGGVEKEESNEQRGERGFLGGKKETLNI